MKKKVILVLTFVLLIIAVIAINPYNLYHHIKAEGTVSSILADPTVRNAAFGNDSEISNIKYLGSNMYRVETSSNTFVIELKKDGSHYNYEIYEFKQKIGAFGH
ncbi:hypothetical protein JOC85_003604 [Bacillus mesophilus]|uniref:DUF3139 domain-containing protein n=1 Tax=Bacillus mesophilus TaxID=1808955 RepID=A0A6M0QFN0_9BACI|nr:hypothetical protein [Bacillus mesophilus]MBM7662793.1 hypothetical protein [Bacillus mesophilus]NEY74258.1 hypothetical protein [Bacillus mesophilus]